MPDPKTVLIVEDEAIIMLATRRKIASFGYEVLGCMSGEEALERVRTERIDLVLMDIDLGKGMDGPEAAERILRECRIPIVFHSSHSERKMVERVRGITRYGYVLKNCGDFVLRSSIEMAFELFDAHERTRRNEARLEALVAAMPDLMFVVDRDGRIEDYRRPDESAKLAVPEDRVVGTLISELHPPEESRAQLELYARVIATGEVLTRAYELEIEGERRSYDLRVSRLDEGRVLAIARDITERLRR